MSMIFLKEYINKNRVAHVFKRNEDNDYVAICYNVGEETQSLPVATEEEIHEWAQAWIANELEVATVADEQQTTVTRGCCD